jgi:hypothetical protein
MDGSRQEFMDLGVVQYVSFPQVMAGTGPVVETIERVLADEFFSAIEITYIEDTRIKRQVADLLSYSGMRVVFAEDRRTPYIAYTCRHWTRRYAASPWTGLSDWWTTHISWGPSYI